jgi:L-Ala-D/L-Glu epimerase
MVEILAETIELRTTHAFTIARAVAPPVRRNVWVRLRDGDGAEGWGEAAPTPYYGETDASVLAALSRYEAVVRREWNGHGLPPIERIERALEKELGRNAAARAAISCALHDLLGRKLDQPLWRLWGLDPTAPASSFTLGIASPDELHRRAREARSYPILKLKLGTQADEEMLRAVRDAAPRARIRIDANTGWTVKRAIGLLPLLEDVGVELVEQPFAADDIASFRLLRERSRIPVVADESCLVSRDVARLAGAVDGVNIKLTKTGSLREALRLVHAARAHGMSVMLGCMIETTLGIGAAVQLAPLVDHLDLDGAALLASDPFEGPGIDGRGVVTFNTGAGLGVGRRAAEPASDPDASASA